jgi:hypothetical protein
MTFIKIQTLWDEDGDSFVEGGIVTVDNQVVIRREPIATSDESNIGFNASELLVMALKKMDIHVSVDGEPYQLGMYDSEYYDDE